MSTLTRKLLLLALCLVVLSACTDQLGSIDITASNNGETIEVQRNQVIAITLESNATTGYKWNWAVPPNPAVLKFLDSKYNSPTGGGVGAGGTETWRFQAVGLGAANIKLYYVQPGAPSEPAGRTFSLWVNVK